MDPAVGLAKMFCPVNLFIPYLAPFLLASLFVFSFLKAIANFKGQMTLSEKIDKSAPYIIIAVCLLPVVYFCAVAYLKTGGLF
jgi:hypothetical protein